MDGNWSVLETSLIKKIRETASVEAGHTPELDSFIALYSIVIIYKAQLQQSD